MIHPLLIYGDGLRRVHDRILPRSNARLRLRDGSLLAMPLERYLGAPDAIDSQVLAVARGPVLDVGCGPGRHLHALAGLGVFALGVDLSPVAVELATGRGARAIVGSIFDELPGIGAWRSALLLDGNVGIGGAPDRLLARIATLLREDGEVLVELESPRARTDSMLARIETPDRVSSWFPWARVAVHDIAAVADSGGLVAVRSWSAGARWFAVLRKRRAGAA